MNISRNINKILFALKQKGYFYRVNIFNFYSDKLGKYCKKYELCIRIEVEKYNDEKHEMEKKNKYIKVLDTFKQVEVLKYLIDELKDYSETGGDADVQRGLDN